VPSDAEVWQLIFAPGFSTADKVTDLSGRGVGMDVVKRNIEALRGQIALPAPRARAHAPRSACR
jgi:two-component system chemotaxis sensor kinase CheA